MIKRLSLALSAVLLMTLLTPTVIFGQDETGESTESSESTRPTVEERQAERQQAAQERLDQRLETQAERQAELDEAKAERVLARCTASQDKLNSHKGRIESFQNAHDPIFERMITKLGDLITRLEANEIDATQLSADLTTLEGLVSQLRADFATYVELVDSAIAFDCENDVDGYYALIEDIRAARSLVSSQVDSIKTFIRETIKADIQAIKDSLGSDEGDDTTTDEEAN